MEPQPRMLEGPQGRGQFYLLGPEEIQQHFQTSPQNPPYDVTPRVLEICGG